MSTADLVTHIPLSHTDVLCSYSSNNFRCLHKPKPLQEIDMHATRILSLSSASTQITACTMWQPALRLRSNGHVASKVLRCAAHCLLSYEDPVNASFAGGLSALPIQYVSSSTAPRTTATDPSCRCNINACRHLPRTISNAQCTLSHSRWKLTFVLCVESKCYESGQCFKRIQGYVIWKLKRMSAIWNTNPPPPKKKPIIFAVFDRNESDEQMTSCMQPQ